MGQKRRARPLLQQTTRCSPQHAMRAAGSEDGRSLRAEGSTCGVAGGTSAVRDQPGDPDRLRDAHSTNRDARTATTPRPPQRSARRRGGTGPRMRRSRAALGPRPLPEVPGGGGGSAAGSEVLGASVPCPNVPLFASGTVTEAGN